ncbi:MAG: bifunctional phosphoserine phosphatase/homoserine phosphotransferase ThrH [Pseudomonadales bacterium]|nr:bifunctional phosphoserine phosphatase/homoserine phosphotransferase ThrH [Pseudomonadales bacterium]MCP5185185.1 bifunctional phosphoserine phosphatase/homoserine phosphotransferase ThrH [Pseudomonadales bacterium]
MDIVCLDLEGVLIPEIWQAVARKVGDDRLLKTTRDMPVYDELMQYRLGIIAELGLTLTTIRDVIASLDVLPGAREFLDALRQDYQVVILSDTFYEFGMPFMAKLGYPTLLCHRLVVTDDIITGYTLRQPDPKRAAVRAFHDLRYTVTAAGDSYNDVAMLEEADRGFFFSAPANVTAQFPQFPETATYAELLTRIRG